MPVGVSLPYLVCLRFFLEHAWERHNRPTGNEAKDEETIPFFCLLFAVTYT